MSHNRICWKHHSDKPGHAYTIMHGHTGRHFLLWVLSDCFAFAFRLTMTSKSSLTENLCCDDLTRTPGNPTHFSHNSASRKKNTKSHCARFFQLVPQQHWLNSKQTAINICTFRAVSVYLNQPPCFLLQWLSLCLKGTPVRCPCYCEKNEGSFAWSGWRQETLLISVEATVFLNLCTNVSKFQLWFCVIYASPPRDWCKGVCKNTSVALVNNREFYPKLVICERNLIIIIKLLPTKFIN